MVDIGSMRTLRAVGAFPSAPRILTVYWRAVSGSKATLAPSALFGAVFRFWALTTIGLSNWRAISNASSGVVASFPSGTGMPYSANRAFDWYSWSFTYFLHYPRILKKSDQ